MTLLILMIKILRLPSWFPGKASLKLSLQGIYLPGKILGFPTHNTKCIQIRLMTFLLFLKFHLQRNAMITVCKLWYHADTMQPWWQVEFYNRKLQELHSQKKKKMRISSRTWDFYVCFGNSDSTMNQGQNLLSAALKTNPTCRNTLSGGVLMFCCLQVTFHVSGKCPARKPTLSVLSACPLERTGKVHNTPGPFPSQTCCQIAGEEGENGAIFALFMLMSAVFSPVNFIGGNSDFPFKTKIDQRTAPCW